MIEPSPEGLPLIPIEAVASFTKGDGVAMKYDIAERYLVPEFSVKGVKYLIRVSGSSMYPKYSNGDVLACRPVNDLTFFQWVTNLTNKLVGSISKWKIDYHIDRSH